jgi:hypothetical protein
MGKEDIYDSPGPRKNNFDFLDELSDVKDELESENGEKYLDLNYQRS